jgi:ribosomal protein L37AE/L43A
MLYRLAHAVNASYGLAVAWAYILTFVLAFCLLFIFPQITLLLFFLGLASLGLTITLGWAIDATTRALARRSLHMGRCPRCGSASERRLEPGQVWLCENCHSEFQAGGGEIDERERGHYVETAPDDPLGVAGQK